MSAFVIACRSIGICSSTGLYAGLLITGLRLQLLLTTSLTQNASKGVWKQFSRTCAIIQIKYCITCPSIRSPRTRVWGPGIRTPNRAGGTVWQPILNLYIKYLVNPFVKFVNDMMAVSYVFIYNNFNSVFAEWNVFNWIDVYIAISYISSISRADESQLQ